MNRVLPTKVIVCAVPKSGTHLLAALVVEFGFRNTQLFLDVMHSHDYSKVDRETSRRHPERALLQLPLAKALNLIASGEFAVGHLPASTQATLSGFRVLFVCRNLRDVLVSYCRWTCTSGRWQRLNEPWRVLPEGPEKLLGFLRAHETAVLTAIRRTIDWAAVDGVPTVRFEELTGDWGPASQLAAARRIARAVGYEATDAAVTARLSRALAADTLTKSSERADRARYWNEAVEAYFVEAGLADWNRKLGYDIPH